MHAMYMYKLGSGGLQSQEENDSDIGSAYWDPYCKPTPTPNMYTIL